MAVAPTTDDWMVDFRGNVPQSTPPAQGFTVFKVPQHLRGGSSDYEEFFKIRMLQLGLQNRTLVLNTSEKVVQNLKLEIASVLHNELDELDKLRKLSNQPPPPLTPGPLTIPASFTRSWDEFATAVVGDVDAARADFENPTDDRENPRMSDDGVRYHLALDALFIVFFFQFWNEKTFNIKNFETLADRRSPTLRSLGLSDFLLLENQVPMYLLKNVVTELCKIDYNLQQKLQELECLQPDSPVTRLSCLVERELNFVLVAAVVNLLPISNLTLVHPRSELLPPMNTFAGALERMRMVASSSKTYMLWSFCCRGDKKGPQDKLVDYLNEYYSPHEKDAALMNCKHILDCVYRVVCGHIEVGTYKWDSKQLENPLLDSIPGAAQLEEVGIKVQHSTQCTGNSVELSCGLHTWIRCARLKLPKVEVLDTTALYFRNLAIYEQLLGRDVTKYNSDLRCYLVCMHELCKDVADLQLLSKRGVMDIHVRHDIVLSMWGRVLQGVERPIPSDAWTKCYKNMINHRCSRWKRWRREHIEKFLGGQPWKPLSIVAAIVLLVLTFLQTWFTVVNSDSSKWKWPSCN